VQLVVDHPLDLEASLLGGQAHRWRKEETEEEAWFSGVVRGNFVRLRQLAADRVEFHASPWPEASCIPILQHYFRLDDNLAHIQKEISHDRRVAAMVGQYPGLRILRQEPWECLVAYICSANSNIQRIHQVMENIARSFGDPIELDGQVRYSFPTPIQLVEAGEMGLRQLGLGFRAPYVDRATREVVEGSLDLNALVRLPYLPAKERLMECYGIGSKIADCIAVFSLEKLEAFPIDVWVRRALGEWYFPGEKPPPDRELLVWAQGYFGQYAGYAQQYLFHGRRLQKRGKKQSETTLVEAVDATTPEVNVCSHQG
jgi:N-glycosylase/DNA lyase